MKGHKVLLSSNSDEWETPQDLYDKLDVEFNFKLDPCCTQENAKCSSFITKSYDGLKEDWSKGGGSVFVNPPYSNIKAWVQKSFRESVLNSLTVVMLIPARVDTSYWHDFIFSHAREVRFIRGRLKFSDHKNPSTFPSAVIVFKNSWWNMFGLKVKTINRR